jgi:hypothetical protein
MLDVYDDVAVAAVAGDEVQGQYCTKYLRN